MMMMYLQKIYISFSMLEYCSSLDIWNESISQEALSTLGFFFLHLEIQTFEQSKLEIQRLLTSILNSLQEVLDTYLLSKKYFT